MSGAQGADVLLLAAGFGKRLEPLTVNTPKPLLEVGDKPLIAWNLELIARSGFSRVFINLHHLGERISEFVGDGSHWGLSVEYSKEDPILETGGAIKNIEHKLREPYLITLNSDILLGPDFSLARILEAHCQAFDLECPVD